MGKEETLRPRETEKEPESTGDTIDLSHSDFRDAHIYIKSTLRNVVQTINKMPDTDTSAKEELEKLIQQLGEALQQIPPEKAEQAEAVAKSADMLVKTAAEEKPNKTMIQNLGGMLKKAAEEVADAMPKVLVLTNQIGKLVLKLIAL